MTARMPNTAPAGLLSLAAGLLLLLCPPAPAATVSPLPPSDYTARAVCPPPAPGEAECLSLALVPQTAAARAHVRPLGIERSATPAVRSPAAGYFGLRPQDLHSAYALPTSAPSAQTIALVDAYNDPTANADLSAYDSEFPALPECTIANGCFRQVNQDGEAGSLPFPQSTEELKTARESASSSEKAAAERAEGWDLEISLDIEVAHATCQSCHIVLVEASSARDEDLDAAEDEAVLIGAEEISNSWGGAEVEASRLESAFDHPGVVISASAGDDGYLGWDGSESGLAEFPATSPDVVAVGGTRLTLGAGGGWEAETVWNGRGAGGGGCSVEFTAQPWQQSLADWSAVGCADKRAVADVAADADPYTGVAVYDSGAQCAYEEEGEVHYGPWCTVGGTSLASPLITATFALAGGSGGVSFPAETLYQNEQLAPSSLHDILTGSNGKCASGYSAATGLSRCSAEAEAKASCSSKLICLAGPGYDGPTGVGTPDGLTAFEPAKESGGGGGPADGASPPPAPSAPPSSTPAAGGEGAGAGSPPPAAPAAPSGGSSPAGAPISALALTFSAIVALDNSHPRISQLEFSCVLSAATRVRATLSKRISRHHHARWQAQGATLTFTAFSGRNRRRLRGHGTLGAGVYRLTLTPAHGSPRSIDLEIG